MFYYFEYSINFILEVKKIGNKFGKAMSYVATAAAALVIGYYIFKGDGSANSNSNQNVIPVTQTIVDTIITQQKVGDKVYVLQQGITSPCNDTVTIDTLAIVDAYCPPCGGKKSSVPSGNNSGTTPSSNNRNNAPNNNSNQSNRTNPNYSVVVSGGQRNSTPYQTGVSKTYSPSKKGNCSGFQYGGDLN